MPGRGDEVILRRDRHRCRSRRQKAEPEHRAISRTATSAPCLGIALALRGKRAIRARVLNAGAIATSVFMNYAAAGHGWRDLAIWVMPPPAIQRRLRLQAWSSPVRQASTNCSRRPIPARTTCAGPVTRKRRGIADLQRGLLRVVALEDRHSAASVPRLCAALTRSQPGVR
jgi:hypothetical protein